MYLPSFSDVTDVVALCLVQQLVPEDLHGPGAITDEAGLHSQNQALDMAQLVLIDTVIKSVPFEYTVSLGLHSIILSCVMFNMCLYSCKCMYP